MLFSLRDIEGFKFRSTDGEFGEVKAFLIDDFDWVVRYIIVEIDDRHVIISPIAVTNLLVEERALAVDVTLETILNSPLVDLDQDLSRELERQLSDYYHWPYYWEPTEYPNTMPGDLSAVPLIDMELEREQEEQDLIPETGETNERNIESTPTPSPEHHNFHLRSTHEIFGYTLFAANDKQNAGKLDDLIVQDQDWKILYMVAETGGLLSSKKVLVSQNWVKTIDEDHRRILVDLKEETIKSSPEFSSTRELTQEFQARLRDHYGK